MALILTILFGTAIHIVEPDGFPTIQDGIWWAIVTMSTVGYGDFSPETAKGRMVGVFLILTGAGVLSAYFVSLSSATVTNQNALMDGKKACSSKGHIVIVGWNERSKEVINQLKALGHKRPIVLIDSTLDQNPYSDHRIHFIKGRPYIDAELKRANVQEADYLLITADQNKNEVQADMHTIMTLLAAKGLKQNVYCVAEILRNEQMANAKRAGADEVIQTNRQTSYIMINSLVSHGISDTILSMLNHLKGGSLQYMSADPEWAGKTFHELCIHMLDDRKLLLGIKKGEETMVNPPLSLHISEDDKLLVISD